MSMIRRAICLARISVRQQIAVVNHREFHAGGVQCANNVPKGLSYSVPMPPFSTLESLGLDNSRQKAETVTFGSSEVLEGTTESPAITSIALSTDGRIEQKRVKEIKIKKFKPRGPHLRWYRRPIHDHLWKGRPLRNLTVAKRKTGGRNITGRLTARNVGGGHRRRLRLVDFHRNEPGSQTVIRIEYDPGRTAHIALISHDKTKALSYILAADGLRSGDHVESFRAGIPMDLRATMSGNHDPAILASRTIRPGNVMPLSMIPLGTVIHCVGLRRNQKGQLCRAAGSSARLTAKDEDRNRAIVRLKSGEERFVHIEACATIGTVSNAEHQFYQIGKAGRSRWLGRRPHVRGMAMNAADHPHGGGRGKSKGNVKSKSAWGTLAKGYKTRRGKKHINHQKVRDRPRGKKKILQPLLVQL
ncbi:mitochondrial 54S ribosomal protein uL2m [Lipomyces oligophaga]|uniref:mitochondrial 54S ribosomal protein uL2m n=1 Tax=Lipomyces oligophaga TaxID=45792 RepID=UPI0034CEF38B